MVMSKINVRCLVSGFALVCPLLASKARGVNQHLRIVRGVEIESSANIFDRLCHFLAQWFLIRNIDTKERAVV